MTFHVPNEHRVRRGKLASDDLAGNNGAFYLNTYAGAELAVIASCGEGWEHVSVSLQNRTPTWEEMCFIKDKFWDAEDCVIQYHPPASMYVNCHPFCLHLWRPTYSLDLIPMPPMWMVGPQTRRTE